MRKNLDSTPERLGCPERPDPPLPPQLRTLVRSADPALGGALRQALGDAVKGLAGGAMPLHLGPAGDSAARAEGHFHLAPELFVQLAGRTVFRFPAGDCCLGPGEALLLPPQLLHAEQIHAGDDGQPFRNLVIYAEADALSCHLAHEARPGQPAVLHLEARRHPQALRVHDWLSDAAGLGPDTAAAAWGGAQQRALVTAAIAGVLRAIDDPAEAASVEPPLVARLRLLMRNQLGDPALSVRGLADQLGCTPDYLSHLFHRSSGEHLVACINRLRLERATRLLGEGRLAGKEVAWACGYASQSYFIRSFRARFGLTPKAWQAVRRGPHPVAAGPTSSQSSS
jgi:AraC-like DNA-binding protein